MRTANRPKSLTSPGERIQVEFHVDEEMQISNLIRTKKISNPRVTDTNTGRVLLDLWQSDWDADIQWLDYATVRLDLFIWNLRRSFSVLINAEYHSYCMLEQDEVWLSLDGDECPVEKALHQELDRRLRSPADTSCQN